jgi:hypothetical protein
MIRPLAKIKNLHYSGGKRQKAKGKRQKAKGKRQKAKGKRQKAKGSFVLPTPHTVRNPGRRIRVNWEH